MKTFFYFTREGINKTVEKNLTVRNDKQYTSQTREERGGGLVADWFPDPSYT